MAVIALAAAGSAIGGAIGGTVLGVSAAAIGSAVGTAIGSAVDNWLFGQLAPTQRIEGRRLDALQITSSAEGVVIPRVYGRMRLGGNIIWATDFREETRTSRQGGGKGGGGGGGAEVTEYFYYASFAVALCEGPITGIGRIWADGKLMDTEGVTYRVYSGDEEQTPDPFIAARTPDAPAYRGTAYVMFEELALEKFGNRIPQLSFEVIRPLIEGNTIENLARSVTLIPSAGEFVYATEPVVSQAGTASLSENVHAKASTANIVVALDQMEAALPKLEAVSLVVAWFGDDLRAGQCRLRPGVEGRQRETAPLKWSVDGESRTTAHVVTSVDGSPLYGGTPSDSTVIQAIQELKRRGLRVTLYPFILMDIPPGNALPNPYSDNAAGFGQPALPWRGRVTCSPAAGHGGSVDKTAAAASQVAAFFGTASDWGFRRMILHYARLCQNAGGVDAFLIGSEMRGLTTIRSNATTYPAVAELKTLAAEARSILGANTKIGYAADWSEYFGHHPGDGSGDVFFHLDPLWADANIDFIGIDNYMPLADWRDGAGHADALAGWSSLYDIAYLQSNIEGGEGFDWYYASQSDRDSQTRTPIRDGAYGKPWVFRVKDIHAWWSNRHHDRPGGVENAAPTAWVPRSKPIRFTEFGCPAVDKGPNQPNVFFDPKSSESFLPYYSRGFRDDAVQRRYLEAQILYWNNSANNPTAGGARMVEIDDSAIWTWDARPYPQFPALTDIWTDGPNWTLGHWLNGRVGVGVLGTLVRLLCERGGLDAARIDAEALIDPVPGFIVTAIESPRASIATLARFFGFDAVESEGRIRFSPRGRAPVLTVTPDELVAADSPEDESFELTRAQESELDQALKWRLIRSDEDFDAVSVEAQRRIGALARVNAEDFPLANIPSEADRQCRRALLEAWAGREGATFRLPPSKLALDPGDVVAFDHDGRMLDYRLLSVGDAKARTVEAVRSDASAYTLALGAIRPSKPARPATYAAPEIVFLDLPQLAEGAPPHQPLIAARAEPWTPMAVWKSAGADNFALATRIERPARIGTLVSALPAGPTSRFDYANTPEAEIIGGALESVTDTALFGGANALALEAAPGVWEVLQFGLADLIAPGRYRLSRLLRGQRGTEHAMAEPAPAGSRIVILDAAVTPLPIAEAEIELPFTWRIGPAARPFTDSTYIERSFAGAGAGLRPFSAAHIRSSRAPGDLAIAWVRRSRALAADSWTGVDVPLSEEMEAYEIDILDGGAVKRTLMAAAPSVIYSVAEQTADWGAPLAAGGSLTIRVAQLSALIGRGGARVETLYL